ncbi:hypothetical protein Salat_0143400 [Sesamum alatum]|uniref:Uncharacterized protein n=1 Tax=Sesamum alatum TaxID=300844 RepID=A0AAE2CXH0_9LAMI|nr:hypothetical protein Salat_0143400 [Sesamum alatum]
MLPHAPPHHQCVFLHTPTPSPPSASVSDNHLHHHSPRPPATLRLKTLPLSCRHAPPDAPVRTDTVSACELWLLRCCCRRSLRQCCRWPPPQPLVRLPMSVVPTSNKTFLPMQLQ